MMTQDTTTPAISPPIRKVLRVGLIGCGKMGIQHLRAIKATPNATVIGVADPQVSREQLAGLLPSDAIIVDDVTQLLAAKPDVVHIVTPPETHTRLALQAIDAGCHVYVEKPFVPTRLEAVEIFARAAQRNVTVCAGHQVLFEAPAVKARELAKTIGALVHVESYFSFKMVRRTITFADQLKDILPHAVYPIVEQLRSGAGLPHDPIEVVGVDARSSGDLYALLRLGNCTGIVLVTLNGRPVEQFQHLVGKNGWMRIDYITGAVTCLPGPGTGPGVLFTPYRRAFRTLTGATRGFAKLIFGRQTSYPGLTSLVGHFYRSIVEGTPPPLSPASVIETVSLCEHIGSVLDEASQRANGLATVRLDHERDALPPADLHRGVVLVTGGTGLLGRRVAQELRQARFRVRVLARRVPVLTARLPGVEYVAGNLAQPLDPAVMHGVDTIAHCAAETAGGKDDHERNSIAATRNVVEAAAAAGIKALIHVSSLAVLKPGHQVGGGPITEDTPIDAGNLARGPYVWGKAESEILAQRLGKELGLAVKVIRPAALVDYTEFYPPGRLGREVGPWFVAIGGKRTPLGICDVGTAARVIRSYAQDFAAAPSVVNLVESPSPTRGELADRFRAERPDLRFFWVPSLLLRAISGPAKLAQRLLLNSPKPLDVYAAFASERYSTENAAKVIQRAGPTPISDTASSARELVRSV